MARRNPFSVVLDSPIDTKKRLGSGCFGAVYEVKLDGATCIAKRLHDILTGARGESDVTGSELTFIIDKFKAECSLLSELRHPNVVQFLGVYEPSDDPRDLALVMEKLYMDLDKLITKYPHTPLAIKLHILRDISCGLLHIHSHSIVHRDLNAGNVLLTRNLQAKVADFGASRAIHIRYPGKLTTAPGATDYMPPEALGKYPKYNSALDVFSFGHLSLYLVNSEYPALQDPSLDSLHAASASEFAGIRMGLQAHRRRESLYSMRSDHILSKLIVSSLHDKPEHRPRMIDIYNEMDHHCSFHQVTESMKVQVLEGYNLYHQVHVHVCYKTNYFYHNGPTLINQR